MAATAEVIAAAARITADADYSSQLVSIISELELSEEAARAYFTTLTTELSDVQKRELKIMQEVMQYEGFNPRVIIQSLLLKHAEMAEAVREDATRRQMIVGEIKVRNVVKQYTFNNNEKFLTDIQFICLMFITRGASYEKITKKSKNLMKETMSLLKAKYGINTEKRRPNITLAADVITIPRIAASFPSITVGLFHEGYGRVLVEPGVIFGQNCPRALLAPMVASMIPATVPSMRAQLMAIAVCVDDLLHQADAKTSMQQLFQYLEASYTSQAITPRVKVKECIKWNLIVNSTTLTPEVSNLRNVSLDKIRALRPNDPMLETIIGRL